MHLAKLHEGAGLGHANVTDYSKHIPKPYKSAFKFGLNLILKGVLPLQNLKTGTFQNSCKITYLSNISVTLISLGDITLGNNYPLSELIYGGEFTVMNFLLHPTAHWSFHGVLGGATS